MILGAIDSHQMSHLELEIFVPKVKAGTDMQHKDYCFQNTFFSLNHQFLDQCSLSSWQVPDAMIFRKPSKDIRGSCVLNGKIQVTRMEICASIRFTYLIHLCFIREIVNKNLNNSGHKGHCLQNTIFSLNYELLSCFPVSPL